MEGDEIVLNVVGVIWYLGATVQVQLKLIAWEPIISRESWFRLLAVSIKGNEAVKFPLQLNSMLFAFLHVFVNAYA